MWPNAASYGDGKQRGQASQQLQPELRNIMRSWIGTHLPLLSLKTFRPRWSEPDGTPADSRRLPEFCPDDESMSLHDPACEIGNQRGPAALEGLRGLALLLASQSEKINRPSFLLAQPTPLSLHGIQPFYGAPLRLIKGPERIETDWRNGEVIVRDYFVAQGKEAACYWIYRERIRQEVHWFLHGLFT